MLLRGLSAGLRQVILLPAQATASLQTVLVLALENLVFPNWRILSGEVAKGASLQVFQCYHRQHMVGFIPVKGSLYILVEESPALRMGKTSRARIRGHA